MLPIPVPASGKHAKENNKKVSAIYQGGISADSFVMECAQARFQNGRYINMHFIQGSRERPET